MTAINIPADAMQTIVQRAILEGISSDQRDLLVEQAVKYLIAPQKSAYPYDKNPSPLESAFNHAVTVAAEKLVNEMVANTPEFMAKVREQVQTSMTAYLEGDTVLSHNVGLAIGNAIHESLRTA